MTPHQRRLARAASAVAILNKCLENEDYRQGFMDCITYATRTKGDERCRK